jgi:hypothetical protein
MSGFCHRRSTNSAVEWVQAATCARPSSIPQRYRGLIRPPRCILARPVLLPGDMQDEKESSVATESSGSCIPLTPRTALQCVSPSRHAHTQSTRASWLPSARSPPAHPGPLAPVCANGSCSLPEVASCAPKRTLQDTIHGCDSAGARCRIRRHRPWPRGAPVVRRGRRRRELDLALDSERAARNNTADGRGGREPGGLS